MQFCVPIDTYNTKIEMHGTYSAVMLEEGEQQLQRRMRLAYFFNHQRNCQKSFGVEKWFAEFSPSLVHIGTEGVAGSQMVTTMCSRMKRRQDSSSAAKLKL